MAETPKPNKRKLTKKHKDTKTHKRLKSNSDSDSDSAVDLFELLEPYTKEQLIDLISGFALNHDSLHSLICRHADGDVSHRKIFVHGLSWDSTSQTLLSAFQLFGEIEDCNVVTDKATGKAKGYGFVLFKTRKAASKALENSSIKIDNRIVSYQLASLGPVNLIGKEQESTAIGARKIYVSNVQVTVEAEKLREFFERFGEIEAGPLGFNPQTGRSKGYALFVYKTMEGANNALQEPYKIFEGHQLHCQKAADGKSKNLMQVVPGQQQQQQQVQGQTQHQQQMLAAMAAAQQMALFGQFPGLNPVYGGFLGNPSAGGLMNPMTVAALNQGVLGQGMFGQAVMPTSQVGVGSQSVLGAIGAGQGLQHVYPHVQGGQLPVGMGAGRGQGPAGSFPGFPSQMRANLGPATELLYCN